MTREEAIKHLELFAKLRKELTVGGQETNDALDLALAALRGPTREHVERMRGVWIGKPLAGYADIRCSRCKSVFGGQSGEWNFCPLCGAPMTDEAVQMVMERLEALKDEAKD